MNEGSIRKLERMMGNPWNGIKKEMAPINLINLNAQFNQSNEIKELKKFSSVIEFGLMNGIQ